jgi:protein-tyrosine phosphatase
MILDRRLNWEGCTNVRDLGGLVTHDGRHTRWGAVVRSDHPANLTATGWSALYAHGIRTIISLYSVGQNEERSDRAPRPADLATMAVAVEDLTDAAFVQQWVNTDLWGTPLYFAAALERWPDRHATVGCTRRSLTRFAPD